MRLPRLRFSVRQLMVVVAIVAMGLFCWEEFKEGVPPRFVVRGIPGRIARLRPGMSRKETHKILGLDRSWIWGGSSATPFELIERAHTIDETYLLREMTPVRMRTASIQVRFHYDEGWNFLKDGDDSLTLVGVSFHADGTTVEMPRAPRDGP